MKPTASGRPDAHGEDGHAVRDATTSRDAKAAGALALDDQEADDIGARIAVPHG